MMTKIGRPREYTDEKRIAVLTTIKHNSYRKTAELCGVSLGMVQRIVREERQSADGGESCSGGESC